MVELTRAIDTPIMADESVFDPKEALLGTHMRIANIFSLKIMKSGGIRRAMEVAAIAHAAGTHLMAAVPDLTLGCEFYMSSYYAKTDIATEPFPVKNGMVHIPQTPGLGVAHDIEKLAKYTTQLLE